MSVKIGVIYRPLVFYLEPGTNKVSGLLSKSLILLIETFFGFNYTFISVKTENSYCARNQCHGGFLLMQQGIIDTINDGSPLTSFDSVYPNISSTQILDQIQCNLVTAYDPELKIYQKDCFGNFSSFSPSVIIFIFCITLCTSLLIANVKSYSLGCLFELLVTSFGFFLVKCNLKKSYCKVDYVSVRIAIGVTVTSLIVLQYNLIYNSGFQTDLSYPRTVKPPDSLQDLINNNWTAYMFVGAPCFRLITSSFSKLPTICTTTVKLDILKGINQELGSNSVIMIGGKYEQNIFFHKYNSRVVHDKRIETSLGLITIPVHTLSAHHDTQIKRFYYLFQSGLFLKTLDKVFSPTASKLTNNRPLQFGKSTPLKMKNYTITLTICFALILLALLLLFLEIVTLQNKQQQQ